jgi:BirA family transcriptional regulator, biotin operon repressor / biotin---[acetyl-CoA-carboxylase] ligase
MHKKLNDNFVKVVHILEDGEYHDGTTIGEKLRLTRSAVWKTVKKLENNHIKIDSIKGKGYALLEPLILLDSNKIKKNMGTEKIEVSIFESIDSTNEYLKTFKNSKSIKICMAEQQTLGKGRLHREWHSPFGKNIYLSCLYPFQKDVSELSGLSLMVSLVIMKTLNTYGIDKNLYVKWPNDILYANKKLSGSLIEIQAETHGACQAIIGIGLNVNMMNDDQGKITQAWTSVQKILNTYVDRNELCAHLIDNLLDYLHQFDANGFVPFIKEWKNADCLIDREITIKNINEKIRGKVIGINEQGHLMLQLEDGEVRTFSSGDTTIVKKVQG